MARKPLQGRTALITGAGRGVGKGIADRLSAAGAAVMIADIQENAAEAVSATLTQKGRRAAHVVTDLADTAAISHMINATIAAFGGLDILVNNARPRISNASFPDNMESWDLAMDVMVTAPAHTIASALPYLEASEHASVLNISSTNAFLISQQPVAYHVAKAAILQLSKHLAYELGPKNIRVNTICPGLVDLEDRPKMLTDDPVHKKVVENIVPLGRASSVADIGGVAVFLCSDAAGYITGQSFTVDGGVSLGDQFACSMRVLEAFDAS